MELDEFWEAVALNRPALVRALSRRYKEFEFTWCEDAISATIIKLAPRVAEIDNDRFFPFFYVAARGKLYEMLRAHVRHSLTDTKYVNPEADPTDIAAEAQALDTLRFFLTRLNSKEQKLLMRMVAGEQTGKLKYAVYHLRERKLKALRKEFDESKTGSGTAGGDSVMGDSTSHTTS